MREGTVSIWREAKGFGFIIPDDGEEDIFVHRSTIQTNGSRILEVGQRVLFVVVHRPKGPQARSVRIL